MYDLEVFEPLVQQLSEVLLEKGWKLATTESCTGGLIAAVCTEMPGSSRWFDRAFVTYNNEAKSEMVGVPAALVGVDGPVTADVARAMAEGALAHSKADLALSVTGIAGPGGAEPGKPVGTVFLGWALRGGPADAKLLQLFGSRKEVRFAAVTRALEQALACLEVSENR